VLVEEDFRRLDLPVEEALVLPYLVSLGQQGL
jgi:hypothetical protein